MRGVALALGLLVAATTAALAEPVSLTVTTAVVTRDPGGFAGMTITLSEESARTFGALTAANVGKTVEIRIDGKPVLSALIRDPIPSGRLRISGDYGRDDLNLIAASVASGAARVEAEVVQR